MYIGKAAQLSGTTIKSIRHYEEIGLLPPPQRNGRYRVYSQHSIELLRFIKCAQGLGFKLNELRAIFHESSAQKQPGELATRAIEHKKHDLLTKIEALQKTHAGLVEFEESLRDAQYQCHFEKLKPGQG